MSGKKIRHIYDPPGVFSDVVVWREYVEELHSSKGDHRDEIERSERIVKKKEQS